MQEHQLKTNSIQQGRLRIFLGLKTCDNVLVVGIKMIKQYKTLLLPCDQHTDELNTLQNNTKYECLLFDIGKCTSKASINQKLEYAERLLTDDGILLIVSTKFITFRCLLTGTTLGKRISVFLPFPYGIEKPDEYLRMDCAMLANSYEYGRLVSWLYLVGIYRFFHNNYFVIKKSVEIEDNVLFRQVSYSLTKHLGTRCRIKIERFDTRLRGALIVFILETETEQHFIARIVTDHKTKSIVMKNQQFLKGLHSSSQVKYDIKVRIPQIVDEIVWQGSTTYLEYRLKGVLAWKLINKKNSNIIFADALQFLEKFNNATKVVKVFDGAMWTQLFEEDTIRFQKIKVPEKLQKKITVLLNRIKSNFLGKTCNFVASHGDFGYGNILLDPRTYKLTGVIDWDTGRKKEFPGIDFFNLLIQQDRSLGQSLLDSVIMVMKQINSDSIPYIGRNYLQPYIATSRDIIFFFGITLFRYMSRAMQYKKVFFKEQEDYMKILQYYEDNLLQ